LIAQQRFETGYSVACFKLVGTAKPNGADDPTAVLSRDDHHLLDRFAATHLSKRPQHSFQMSHR